MNDERIEKGIVIGCMVLAGIYLLVGLVSHVFA